MCSPCSEQELFHMLWYWHTQGRTRIQWMQGQTTPCVWLWTSYPQMGYPSLCRQDQRNSPFHDCCSHKQHSILLDPDTSCCSTTPALAGVVQVLTTTAWPVAAVVPANESGVLNATNADGTDTNANLSVDSDIVSKPSPLPFAISHHFWVLWI